jgi:hypothetical protein
MDFRVAGPTTSRRHANDESHKGSAQKGVRKRRSARGKEGGSPASYIPAPESFTTVAAFRPWRDLQTIVAREPTGPPLKRRKSTTKGGGQRAGCTRHILCLALRATSLLKSASCRFVEPTISISRVRFPPEPQYIFKWRRERDSNPRSGYKPLTHFPGVLLQPLGHLSGKGCAEYRTQPPQTS